jgi:hypothetical protein
VELRREIDRLLEADRRDLDSPGTRGKIEDVLQRGFVAVQIGELWVGHLRQEFESEREDHDRGLALATELRAAERRLEAVRRHVGRLYARGRELSVGSLARAARKA